MTDGAVAAGALRAAAIAFLQREGYSASIDASDEIVVTTHDAVPVAAVRLATEHGVLVLRGMRVASELRRRGIGRALLRTVDAVIGARPCWCIPYRWLISFYATIGFSVLDPARAPTFLQERLASYRARGLDVVLSARA